MCKVMPYKLRNYIFFKKAGDFMYKSKRISKKTIPLAVITAVLVLFAARCAVVKSRHILPAAENAGDIAVFLLNFGWETDAEPVSVKNVQIPAKFTEVYKNYNVLQKKQGFDLSKYRAEIVESYCFRVLNHPAAGDVFANILVFKGKIIGGDICSYAVNGFMTGFDGQPAYN